MDKPTYRLVRALERAFRLCEYGEAVAAREGFDAAVARIQNRRAVFRTTNAAKISVRDWREAQVKALWQRFSHKAEHDRAALIHAALITENLDDPRVSKLSPETVRADIRRLDLRIK